MGATAPAAPNQNIPDAIHYTNDFQNLLNHSTTDGQPQVNPDQQSQTASTEQRPVGSTAFSLDHPISPVMDAGAPGKGSGESLTVDGITTVTYLDQTYFKYDSNNRIVEIRDTGTDASGHAILETRKMTYFEANHTIQVTTVNGGGANMDSYQTFHVNTDESLGGLVESGQIVHTFVGGVDQSTTVVLREYDETTVTVYGHMNTDGNSAHNSLTSFCIKNKLSLILRAKLSILICMSVDSSPRRVKRTSS